MKERLDVILVERGIAASRERARALIMEGKILVNDAPVTKAGAMFTRDVGLAVRGGDIPYVSRGGLKLEAAIEHFGIDLDGAVAMDVGSSTGGFTDCMLQKGARKIYCIDVGYGQLSWSLRNDARVVLFERTNIRHLDRKKVPEEIDFASIDVSFISLKKILPKVAEFLGKSGEILALVKPQFEVGRGEVGKGGIVREEDKRLAAVDSVRAFAEGMGLKVSGEFRSPVPGQKGNIEFFLLLRKP
ncbi:MAG TPA: TlyA family RNA methyltransferase [Thermodesulfovibrionales bacterium]|jgi:23S rRNA (cytidine1920-2'-O)/16S rRNA (cytidine1409-2'-O)-methyltransferase|nr:TlyA family RNA methyltransferase [Thermodesulfovibrionales bacterium]